MSKPQVIAVPALAGMHTNPPVQIPISVGVVTLINLSNTMGLTLCNDDKFVPSTTWPLNGGMSAPQPNINNLWIQNPNKSEIDVLVLLGDSIPSYSPISLNSGGLLQAGIGSLSGATWTMVLPTPTSGYAYRIQSITIINQTSTSQLFQIASLFEGSTLYLPFFAQNLSANSAQSFSLNGQLITTSIAQNLTGTGIGVNMFYDLVKL